MEDIVLTDVQWHPKTNKLDQVPKEGLEYAFVSKNNQQVHQLVWCKDFLQDAVFAQINNRRIEIYGFEFNPRRSPKIDLKKTRIMITNFKDKDFQEKLFTQCLPLLHHVEKRLKMPKTKASKCTGTPPVYGRSGVWMLEASRRWQKAPPMISLYSFLIRLGFVHCPKNTLEDTLDRIGTGFHSGYYDDKRDEYTPRDVVIANEARDGIDLIMKYGDQRIFPADLLQNYPKRIRSIDDIHEMCGITGFSTEDTLRLFPEWHRIRSKNMMLNFDGLTTTSSSNIILGG